MEIARTIEEARRSIESAHSSGLRVGFVPTMGYLHEGHLSLIDLCKKHADYIVVSIFVNPTQFGPQEDYERYPRDFERDRKLLEERGVDLLFAPEVDEIYPEEPLIRFEISSLADHLCGPKRPGHFQGVLLIVAKLLNIIRPDVAVFGQKDLQQLLIIKRMVKDLNFPVEIIAAPTVREPDGLAMSSRNSYLSAEERREAAVLYRALKDAQARIEAGERNPQAVIKGMEEMISQAKGAKIDYIEIVELEGLQPVRSLEGRFAIALAVYFGRARLIDNIVLEVRDGEVREITALE
jgi:pantoate--beta-alanine ligase